MQKLVIEVTENQYMRLRRLVVAREKFREEIGEPPLWTPEKIIEQGIENHVEHLERIYRKELGLPGKVS